MTNMTNRVPQEPNDEELYQLSKEQLVEIIKALQNEMARLKESLNLDSKTSSKPPSGDLLKKSEQKKAQPETEETKTKRKPGGQPGHEGKTRKGFGRIDRIEILRPEICDYCGGADFASAAVNLEVQQVAQLVANPIEIVEYHRHHSQCCHCGRACAANWSDEMIPGQDLGVRLQALLGWLGNYAHVPYSKMCEFLFELGEIDIGEGTLVATNQRVAQAIEPPVKALGRWVKNEQPNVHVDETPWSVKGVKEWLWVVANQTFCLFHAADTRSRAELEHLLGCEYRGVLCSDDFSVYNGQACDGAAKMSGTLTSSFSAVDSTSGSG